MHYTLNDDTSHYFFFTDYFLFYHTYKQLKTFLRDLFRIKKGVFILNYEKHQKESNKYQDNTTSKYTNQYYPDILTSLIAHCLFAVLFHVPSKLYQSFSYPFLRYSTKNTRMLMTNSAISTVISRGLNVYGIPFANPPAISVNTPVNKNPEIWCNFSERFPNIGIIINTNING